MLLVEVDAENPQQRRRTNIMATSWTRGLLVLGLGAVDCRLCGQPFGPTEWVVTMIERFGLTSTVRSEGRPQKMLVENGSNTVWPHLLRRSRMVNGGQALSKDPSSVLD